MTGRMVIYKHRVRICLSENVTIFTSFDSPKLSHHRWFGNDLKFNFDRWTQVWKEV